MDMFRDKNLDAYVCFVPHLVYVAGILQLLTQLTEHSYCLLL